MESLSNEVILGIVIAGAYEYFVAIVVCYWVRDFLRGRWYKNVKLPRTRILRYLCIPLIWISVWLATSVLIPLKYLYEMATWIPRGARWCFQKVGEDRNVEKGLPIREPRRDAGGYRSSGDTLTNNTFTRPATILRELTEQPSDDRAPEDRSSPRPPPPAHLR
ncbi:hypothetical protein F4677DRAFT_445569 [Hypoxylon crocopeplum]|nr:hypothetical protein F4677DRAFT_445569 [Hypoxylon crocopeplum]